MRYHTLFYAGLLPIFAIAQSAPSGSGFAHPTGVSKENETATWYKPVPMLHSPSSASLESKTSSELSKAQSANLTAVVIPPSISVSTTSKSSHQPYTKSAGNFFANTTIARVLSTGEPVILGTGQQQHTRSSNAHYTNGTSGFAQPTAKGGEVHVSGTGSPKISPSGHVPYSKGGSSFLWNGTSTKVLPTGTSISHISGTGAQVSISGTGRLPFSKGTSAFSSNGTAVIKPTGTGVSRPPGTGVTAGFAMPTMPGNHTKQAQNPTALGSTSGHLPFSKGTFFGNETSLASFPSGTGVSRPSGIVASSGFAKPTAAGSFTKTAQNTTLSPSTSGRLPFSKGSSAFFGNSTSASVPTETYAIYPTGTGVSPGFAKPTVAANYTALPSNKTASGHLPFTKSGALFPNSTVTLIPTAALSTGISSSGAQATGSGHLPYTKPSGALFLNSTVAVIPIAAIPTGLVPTGAVSTAISSTNVSTTSVFSSGIVSAPSGRPLYSKSSGALFWNSTSRPQFIAVPSGLSSTGVIGSVSNASSTSFLTTPTSKTIASTNMISMGTGLPFPKSRSAIFANYTSGPAPTVSNMFSTGLLPTAASTTTVNSSTSRSVLPSSSFSIPINGSSSIAALSSSNVSSKSRTLPITSTKNKKPHHKQTVTVTVTAAPVTITQAGTTVTDYTTITPSAVLSSSYIAASGTGSSAEETTTVTVVQSLSGSVPMSSSSSFEANNLHISTSSVIPTSSVVSSSTSNSSTMASNTSIGSSTIVSTPTKAGSSSSIISVPASRTSSTPTTFATVVAAASSSSSSSSLPIVTASSTSSSAAEASSITIAEYYQCGGLNWTGSGSCAKGTVCKYWNAYYSQCVDERSA